jgi:hypothetical protein
MKKNILRGRGLQARKQTVGQLADRLYLDIRFEMLHDIAFFISE